MTPEQVGDPGRGDDRYRCMAMLTTEQCKVLNAGGGVGAGGTFQLAHDMGSAANFGGLLSFYVFDDATPSSDLYQSIGACAWNGSTLEQWAVAQRSTNAVGFVGVDTRVLDSEVAAAIASTGNVTESIAVTAVDDTHVTLQVSGSALNNNGTFFLFSRANYQAAARILQSPTTPDADTDIVQDKDAVALPFSPSSLFGYLTSAVAVNTPYDNDPIAGPHTLVGSDMVTTRSIAHWQESLSDEPVVAKSRFSRELRHQDHQGVETHAGSISSIAGGIRMSMSTAEPTARLWPVLMFSGDPGVTVNELDQAHSVDSVAVTENVSLSIADVTQSQAVESVTLQENITISVAEVNQAQLVDVSLAAVPGELVATGGLEFTDPIGGLTFQ